MTTPIVNYHLINHYVICKWNSCNWKCIAYCNLVRLLRFRPQYIGKQQLLESFSGWRNGIVNISNSNKPTVRQLNNLTNQRDRLIAIGLARGHFANKIKYIRCLCVQSHCSFTLSRFTYWWQLQCTAKRFNSLEICIADQMSLLILSATDHSQHHTV